MYTFLLQDSNGQQWHVGPTESGSWQGVLYELVHPRKVVSAQTQHKQAALCTDNFFKGEL